jgi:hypothetical protein
VEVIQLHISLRLPATPLKPVARLTQVKKNHYRALLTLFTPPWTRPQIIGSSKRIHGAAKISPLSPPAAPLVEDTTNLSTNTGTSLIQVMQQWHKVTADITQAGSLPQEGGFPLQAIQVRSSVLETHTTLWTTFRLMHRGETQSRSISVRRIKSLLYKCRHGH